MYRDTANGWSEPEGWFCSFQSNAGPHQQVETKTFLSTVALWSRCRTCFHLLAPGCSRPTPIAAQSKSTWGPQGVTEVPQEGQQLDAMTSVYVCVCVGGARRTAPPAVSPRHHPIHCAAVVSGLIATLLRAWRDPNWRALVVGGWRRMEGGIGLTQCGGLEGWFGRGVCCTR